MNRPNPTEARASTHWFGDGCCAHPRIPEGRACSPNTVVTVYERPPHDVLDALCDALLLEYDVVDDVPGKWHGRLAEARDAVREHALNLLAVLHDDGLELVQRKEV